MPKLLIADPAQPAPMPTATPAAFGAEVGQAMDTTGRVSQALGQVIGQYVETEARASAVRYEQALETEARTIALDPDLPSRMQKFDEAQKRLIGEYRPKWGGGATYDARAGLSTMDLHGRFAHATMLDAIKQSRANNELERDHYATRAANAETEDEALSYLAQAKESLEAGSLYMSAAERTVAEQETIGKTIELAATTNPELADGLMNRFGNMLSPEVQTKLRGSIATEANYIEAQRVSDLALDTLGPGASITDLTRFVRQNSEGKVRSEAESRVRVAYNDREAAKLDSERAVGDAMWDRIHAGAGVEAIPRGLPASIENPARAFIEARSKAAAEGVGFNPKTDPTVYIPLLELAEKAPAEFAKVNLPAHRLSLSDEHYNQLVSQQKAIRKPGTSSTGTTSPSGMSALEIAKGVAKEAGIDVSGDGEQWTAFALRANDAMEALQATQPDKPLTHQQKREIAVGQLTQVNVTDGGWLWRDANKRIGELTVEDRETIKASPPADLDARARKALGADADDEMVRDWIDEWLTLQGVPTDGN